MEVLAEGEICYAEGSYYSVGISPSAKVHTSRYAKKSSFSVGRKLAKLISGLKAHLPASNSHPSSVYMLNTAARATAGGSLPDASLAMPMRERYLRHTNSNTKLAALPSASFTPVPVSVPIPLASQKPPQTNTLIGLTPEQITSMHLEEFRTRFTATPLARMTTQQLAVIDAEKELSRVAHDVLDHKALKKRAVAAPCPQTSTLAGLTTAQLKTLPPEEFRARFAATPVRALTAQQLACIDVEKTLSRIAHDVLDHKADARNHTASMKHGVMQITLPRKLETFVTQQVEAGFYRDASELLSESLRLLQKQTDLRLLRLSLQREIEVGIRDFQEGRFRPDDEIFERLRDEQHSSKSASIA